MITLASTGVAQAQTAAASCNVTGGAGTNPLSVNSGGAFQAMDLGVTVSNGRSSTANFEVHFSGDIGVPNTAEVRFGLSIDGRAVSFYGPQNLADTMQYFETRSTLSVVPLAPGRHTIVPYWRLSGSGGLTATMVDRCLVARIM